MLFIDAQHAELKWAIIALFGALICIILAISVYMKSTAKKRKCDAKTHGIVKYNYVRDGIMPIVEFEIEGQTRELLPYTVAFLDSMYDRSRTNDNARAIVEQSIRDRYPEGGKVEVFYNSKNLEESYLETHFTLARRGLNPIGLLILAAVFVGVAIYFFLQ